MDTKHGRKRTFAGGKRMKRKKENFRSGELHVKVIVIYRERAVGYVNY